MTQSDSSHAKEKRHDTPNDLEEDDSEHIVTPELETTLPTPLGNKTNLEQHSEETTEHELTPPPNQQ